MTFRSLRRSIEASVVILLALLVASGSGQQEVAPRIDENQGLAIAPYAAQILQLAALDPVLAVTLIPDPWVDFLVAGALGIEAEVAVRPSEIDPPRRWPIGPWTGPNSLASAIGAVDPASLAALYRELKPRLAVRCRQHGLSIAKCDRVMRATGSRLSDRSVLERAASGSSSPITPTQRALARLGVPVVTVLRDQIRLFGIALWGPSWSVGS